MAASSGRIDTLTEAAGGLSRSVSLGYDTANRLHTITDSIGGVTTFGYGTGSASSPTNQVVSISNPDGKTTALTYSGAKVTQVSQTNTATGSPGTSTTRLSYASSSQTLVADPTTDQTQAVSAVAHTTYALTTDGTMLVASATDADGHAQSATYNPQNNTTLTQTSAAGGKSTYSYGANTGESLTEGDSPGGAKGTASYTNSGASQYQPNSATNSAGNQLSFTYNGAGNALSSTQATVSANVGYNSLGQPTSSQSPGAAAGVQTTYSYDGTTHNLSSTTPVSGTNLGTRAFTWDGFSRLVTAGDGCGNTVTYSYDNADRITAVAYSDTTTHGVSYTYDPQGRPTRRVDGSGTTTWTYDDLGRLLTVANTAGGGTEAYTYDLAGALASKKDTSGTTTYSYSPGHRVTKLTYPQGGSNLTTQFGYDPYGRRQDVWMQTDGALDAAGNAAPKAWAAHQHTTYDTSGRVTAVLGQQGPATSATTVVNQSACYNTGSPAPTCSTAPATDQSRLQFIIDAVSGETATFGYDDHLTGQGQTGRLLSTVITGGSNPRAYRYAYTPAGDRSTAATTHDVLTGGQTIGNGQGLASPDGTQTFVMQADGNAVLYGPAGAYFSTGTRPTGSYLAMQTDGNMVIYNTAGQAVYQSGTAGNPGAKLVLQNDDNLVIYSTTGAALWSTNTRGASTSTGTAWTGLAGTQTLSYNNANQITTPGYTYDPAGNQTAAPAGTATFNTAAQQTSVVRSGTTTSYTYAGTNSNQLLSEATPGGHTYALTYGRPDQSGLPEIEQVHYDSATGYVQHDPTTGGPLMLQTNSNVTCLYMTDIIGNPVLLSTSFNTTSAAYAYDPYGAATQTSGGTNGGTTYNPYLYHFGLQDRITGNIKFGARFYDPTTGTWTQQDTYNAPLSPGNANRYLYAGGDPINAADPTGQGFWGDLLQGIGSAVATAGAFLPPGLGAAAGAAGAALDVAGGIVNGDSAGNIAAGASVDLLEGAIPYAGSVLGVEGGAALGLNATSAAVSDTYGYASNYGG